jgi:hypothetical protein
MSIAPRMARLRALSCKKLVAPMIRTRCDSFTKFTMAP